MDNRNTVIYVKVKGKRPADFKDPEPFEWNEDKDQQLWKFISKLYSSIEQIDWAKLSTILNTPKEFLKQRSYKLFSMHVSLMKRQLEIKKLPQDKNNNVEVPLATSPSIKNPGNDETITQRENTTSPTRNIQTVFNSFKESPVNSAIRSETKLSDIANNDDAKRAETDTNQDALSPVSIKESPDQPHISKLLAKDPNMARRSSHTSRERKTENEDYDSDLSSTLSVSKSALEEALLERLHF